MSLPWLKVWVGDMMGDPRIQELSAGQRWWLIVAWYLAADDRHGAYGELRRPDGQPHTPATFARATGLHTNAAVTLWVALRDTGVASPADDGALVFGKLARRQGHDPGVTDRVRLHRARKREAAGAERNANETASETAMKRRGNAGEPEPEKKGLEEGPPTREDARGRRRGFQPVGGEARRIMRRLEQQGGDG